MAKIDNKEHRFPNIKEKPIKQISLHEFAAFGSDKVKISLYILNRQQIALLYTFKKLTIIKTKTKMSFFCRQSSPNKEKNFRKENTYFMIKRFLPLNQRESNNNTDTTASFLS